MQPFFLEVSGSQRFCVFHPPLGSVRGALVHVHPFAEEMNLARRMSALQARAFAGMGYAVLQIDLFGCGDSDGDFGAATWATWIDDLVLAAKWLQEKVGVQPSYWGVRAGCLLAVEVARVRCDPTRFLFWQPVVAGDVYWRQFHRIRTATDAMVKPTDRVDARQPEEVAGYLVSAGLQSGLAASRLELPPVGGPVVCVELTPDGEHLSPAVAAQVAAWREQGYAVCARAMTGPAFWQSPEAEDCPALIQATGELVEAEWV